MVGKALQQEEMAKLIAFQAEGREQKEGRAQLKKKIPRPTPNDPLPPVRLHL